MNENKTNINWLACIYGDYHLNPYKMGVFKNWDFASFSKKRRKIWKNRVKYTHFCEKLGYWLITCRHIYILVRLIMNSLIFNKWGDDNELFNCY